MGLPVIGLAVRLVANGVGLTAEAIQARKKHTGQSESKQEQAHLPKRLDSDSIVQVTGVVDNDPSPTLDQAMERSPQEAERLIAKGAAETIDARVLDTDSKSKPYEDDIMSEKEETFDDDEEAWALDEIATSTTEPIPATNKESYGIDAQPTISSMVNTILGKCPAPPITTSKLSKPVILPQRRPGNKQRGFVHAYAPDLASKGIDETTFLAFIDTFRRATSASPILGIISVSAGIVGFVPEPTAQITSAVISVVAGTAIEVQRRQRTNFFLDEVNERLFKPRGLYAMVMSFKPNQKKAISAETCDINTLISSREDISSSTLKDVFKNSTGTTYSELELPESAALKFSDLDQAVEKGDTKLEAAGNFLADYYDRRAQALYAANAPNSALSMPEHRKPSFASRFSDPNDPVHNGSLVTLLTGGKVVLGGRKAERREARRDARAERRGAGGLGGIGEVRRGRNRGARKMKKGVLYLMVVNMPSAEDLEVAREMMR